MTTRSGGHIRWSSFFVSWKATCDGTQWQERREQWADDGGAEGSGTTDEVGQISQHGRIKRPRFVPFRSCGWRGIRRRGISTIKKRKNWVQFSPRLGPLPSSRRPHFSGLRRRTKRRGDWFGRRFAVQIGSGVPPPSNFFHPNFYPLDPPYPPGRVHMSMAST
jgi:hypothetical protein